ncbi:hypothetical protein [Lacticaseibacillus paracasei]|uniref:hypothetical protein n=1 Tax=Lacticaseibacillus paracasei TaxID=1597 RepID=UPI002F268937
MKHFYRTFSFIFLVLASLPQIFFKASIEATIFATLVAILFALWDIADSIREAQHE